MTQTKDKTAQLVCHECDFEAFKRNYYFTGKLLVERDFTDEQRYYMEKLRHHHQRLHGWGVVCGLKVKQHESPACQERFVCIEPGTAVDCCGHEILVPREECIDINQFDAMKALIQNEDTEPHTLQICVRYLECPTEEIPVLYDECGCDDTRCAPNRILESYEFDVIVDPEETCECILRPRLQRQDDVTLAHASHVALHDSSHRLYVLTDSGPSTLYQVSTDNHVVVAAHDLPATGVALAVSNDGSHVYVVTEPEDGGSTDLRQLFVLETTALTLIRDNPISIPNSADSAVYLVVAPAPDNRLFALVATPGNVLVWDADINDDETETPAEPKEINLGANLRDLVIGSDAGHAYAADPANHQLCVLDIAAEGAGTSITVLPADAEPYALAVVSSTGPDLLAVADHAKQRMVLVGLDPSPSLLGCVNLDHKPVALVASPGGRWAYVLERDDDGTSYVQPVNVFRLQQGHPVEPGEAIEVGNASQGIVRSESGQHLYVPYLEDLAVPIDGGVATLGVSELACEDLVWRHLDGCPACDTPNCVVLATIENYNLGDRMEDQTDPPANPVSDETNHIARIDNRKGRRLLPSTQVLAEILKCLLEQGIGGPGQQGPPGPPGKDGKDGKDGRDGADGRDGRDGADGRDGRDGEPGEGLEGGLVQIGALSWRHAEDNILVPILDQEQKFIGWGIVIGFTGGVLVSGGPSLIDADHVFQVRVDPNPDQSQKVGIRCWCSIVGRVIPVKPDFGADRELIVRATEVPGPTAKGVAFIPRDGFERYLEGRDNLELWVRLRGDFVLDESGERAIDAEFVRAQLPTGDRPRGSQVGIQGGLFESWFTITSRQPFRLADVNLVARSELLTVNGIGPATADRILEERAVRPFTDLEDFRARVQPNARNWDLMRDEITVRTEEG